MRRLILGTALLSAFGLAACHANFVRAGYTARECWRNPDVALRRYSGVDGRLFITLPGIAPSPEPTPGTARGFLLGHATTALTISVNGKPLQKYPIDLTYPSSQSKCVAATPHSDVSVCTVMLDVPSGQRQAIQLMTAQTNSGMEARVALAVAAATVDIAPGNARRSHPAFHAVARRLVLQLTRTKMWQNTPAASLATVYGVDAACELIPGRRRSQSGRSHRTFFKRCLSAAASPFKWRRLPEV